MNEITWTLPEEGVLGSADGILVGVVLDALSRRILLG